MTMDKIVEEKSYIVATHASDLPGPPHALINYLADSGSIIGEMQFPLSPQDNVRANYSQSKGRNKRQLGRFKLNFKPFTLNYFRDVLLTVFWSRRLVNLNRNERKDVTFVGCNNILAATGVILRKIGIVDKVIFYAIDYADERFENKLLNGIYLSVDKFAAKRADFVWSNTNRTRLIRTKQGVRSERNVLVPNGAPKSMVSRQDKLRKESVDSVLKLEYHGYLSEGKGLQHVITAISELKDKHSEKIGFDTSFDISFDIVGYGPYSGQLETITKRLGLTDRVKFLGKKTQEECIANLPNYDLCLNPINSKENYLYYCDPLKIKESLASGVPVLTSSLPEIAEAISENGWGYVVRNSENVEELVSVLSDIIDNREKLDQMKKRLNDIKFNFTWEEIFRKTL